jgi:hypothetical protein
LGGWQRIFGRERLGQMWADGMPPRVAEFVREETSLEIVDVTAAAGSTSGNGHAYFDSATYAVFTAVPEPGTGLLVAAGLFGLAAKRRRSRWSSPSPAWSAKAPGPAIPQRSRIDQRTIKSA